MHVLFLYAPNLSTYGFLDKDKDRPHSPRMESRVLSQSRTPFPSLARSRWENKPVRSLAVAVLTRPPPDSITSVKTPEKVVEVPKRSSVYNDNWFDRLAIDHLSRSVQSATGLRNNKSGYESLVEAAMAASRNFSMIQLRELVIQALHIAVPEPFPTLIKMLPSDTKFAREYFAAFTTLFFVWLVGACELRESEINGRKEKNVVHIKKCRFLEETNCAGLCTNLCKVPSQSFIKDALGMPVNMVPNFDDMSCEMIFGQDPPALTDDPAFTQPCYKLCKANLKHRMKCPS